MGEIAGREQVAEPVSISNRPRPREPSLMPASRPATRTVGHESGTQT